MPTLAAAAAATARPTGATMGYLAGAIAIAYILFGWSFNVGLVPVGWILVAVLLIADISLES